jgi:hypothetical protein
VLLLDVEALWVLLTRDAKWLICYPMSDPPQVDRDISTEDMVRLLLTQDIGSYGGRALLATDCGSRMRLIGTFGLMVEIFRIFQSSLQEALERRMARLKRVGMTLEHGDAIAEAIDPGSYTNEVELVTYGGQSKSRADIIRHFLDSDVAVKEATGVRSSVNGIGSVKQLIRVSGEVVSRLGRGRTLEGREDLVLKEFLVRFTAGARAARSME